MSLRTRGTVHAAVGDVCPGVFPGHGEDAPLDLPQMTAQQEAQLRDLIVSGLFDAWSESLARVGNCAHPIRLTGQYQAVDARTGEILSAFSSSDDPQGVVYVRCGNRRANVCPSCSRLYAADMFHLLRAGIVGGKTVPERVAENPLVFATLTAPSFGAVHGRRDTGPCRHTGRRQLCEHGRPTDFTGRASSCSPKTSSRTSSTSAAADSLSSYPRKGEENPTSEVGCSRRRRRRSAYRT